MKRTFVAAAVLVGSLAASGSAVAAPPLPAPAPCSGCWRPGLVTSWQWQLQGTIDQSVDAQMYDVDLFDAPASTVAALHAKGGRVVCYVSAGLVRGLAPGRRHVPRGAARQRRRRLGGRALARRAQCSGDALGADHAPRLDLCSSKGFDAVEFDNVDGYTNGPGFPITAADQLYYNAWLANEAHQRGLSVGAQERHRADPRRCCRTSTSRSTSSASSTASARRREPATATTSSSRAGKAVFGVEYRRETSTFCSKANALNFNWLKKRVSLNKTRTACR